MASMRLVITKTLLDTLASHPSVLIHPGEISDCDYQQ